ncbi:MAG: hypothetical protein KFF73_20400 [Cyclobacteriaceae bacterium]|nr:hypothetical protein [Cyclobacteriaceae bacterium]
MEIKRGDVTMWGIDDVEQWIPSPSSWPGTEGCTTSRMGVIMGSNGDWQNQSFIHQITKGLTLTLIKSGEPPGE